VKIGLFGGSFDPIHFGHLNLALSLMEAHRLDRVLFCPSWLSPSKAEALHRASAPHRLQMTRLAIAEIPAFSLLESEVQREGFSYTIDTVRALLAGERRGSALHLILGEDAFQTLSAWKEADALRALAPPLVGGRSGGGAHCTPIPLMEISSTRVRERIREGKYCGHLVPAKVLDYIRQHRLYC
jgi:nicotinate-nucleotide adenylyltransferase